MYSVHIVGLKEMKKAKGINKTVVKNYIVNMNQVN